MMLLLLKVGNTRLALDCEPVVEIVPWVHLQELSHTPAYVKGLMNYRGIPTPVIDLRCLLYNEPCEPMLHTRIVVLKYQEKQEESRRIGILAECVTSTLKVEKPAFSDSGLASRNTPYLGGVLQDETGGIQWLRWRSLIDYVREEICDVASPGNS